MLWSWAGLLLPDTGQGQVDHSHSCHGEINQSICYQPHSQLSWWDQSIKYVTTTVTTVMVRSINQYVTNHSHSCHGEINQSICYQQQSQLSWWDQSINILLTTVTAVMMSSINQYVTIRVTYVMVRSIN